MATSITLFLLVLFVLEIMVIGGYFIAAVHIVPKLPRVGYKLLLSASLFFATCSLTHLQEFLHFAEVVVREVSSFGGLPEVLLFLPVTRVLDYMSIYMLTNMLVQGIAVFSAIRYCLQILRGEYDDQPDRKNINRDVSVITGLYIFLFVFISFVEHEVIGGSVLLGLLG